MVEPAADSMRVPAVRSRDEVAENERSEIVGRPLFWSSRRPADVDAADEQPGPREETAGKLRDVKQVGVFGSGSEAGIIALVKGKKRRILLGETLDGWELESIRATESEFVKGGRRETLTLRRGKVSASPGRDAEQAAASAPAGTQAPVAGPQGPTRAPQKAPSAGSGGASAATADEDDDGLSLGQRSWRRPPSE
jgi:hypothetical protein